MLHLLFLILKIIGILLLVLLGLAVVLILLLLFVPVRYRAAGEKNEHIQVKASVSWLLHILHFSFQYDGKSSVLRLRIFGIPVWRSNKAQRNSRQEKKTGEEYTEFEDEPESEDGMEPEEQPEPEDGMKFEEQPEPEYYMEPKEKSGSEEGPSIFKKIAAFFRHLRMLFVGLPDFLREIWKSVRNFKDSVSRVWNWWKQDSTQNAAANIKGELKVLILHILPVKYDINLRIGTGDPASTGQLLGAVSLIYPFTKGQLRITPDFQEKILQGKFRFKGRIQIIKPVKSFIRIYSDQNVKQAIQNWKKHH